MRADELIQKYYDCFNARRLDEAAALLAPDATLDHSAVGLTARGSGKYPQVAQFWLSAFPDAALSIERVDQPRDEWYEVHFMLEGTHARDLDLGAMGTIKATGQKVQLRGRQLLRIVNDRIASTTLSIDTHALIRQLTAKD